MSKPAASCFLLYALACIAFALPLAAASESVLAARPAERDGQHDFDFNLGKWHTHIRPGVTVGSSTARILSTTAPYSFGQCGPTSGRTPIDTKSPILPMAAGPGRLH